MKEFILSILITISSFLGFNSENQRQIVETPHLGAGVMQVVQGGTSTGTAPTYGQMLVGNSGGTYTLTATSSLGIVANSVSGGSVGMLTSWLTGTSLTATSAPTASYYTATSTTATSTFAGALSALNLGITGTGGLGYIDLIGQASAPVNPSAGTGRLHTTESNGFTRLEYHNEALEHSILGRDNIFVAKNTSGGAIAKGQIVYVTGSVGAVPTVSLAKADSLTTLNATIGIATETSVANNNFGQFMIVGILENIDTSAFTAGNSVYVSATTAGLLTNTKPAYPNFQKFIGVILNSGVGNGSILVNVAPFNGGAELGTNASNYIFGGNVGIGTTSPGSLLSIGGNGTGINFIDGISATSTISGNLHIKGNQQVDGHSFAPVTLVSSGNATINGSLTVTGQTTLATSLTGLLKGASGVVSAITTSLGLAGEISDETGSGALVFGTSPVFTTQITTPSIISSSALGITPASGSNLNVNLAGTGDFAVNTSQFYVDTSLGRVGIGTTTPGAKLQVAQTGGYTTIGDTDVALSVYNPSVTSANLAFGIDGTTASIMQSRDGTASSFPLSINPFGGNVGIGTVSPISRLSVYSDPAGGNTYTDGLTLTTGNPIVGFSLWYKNLANTESYIDSRYDHAGAAMYFRMRANGTPVNAMTILGSGNVGVGEVSPGSKLSVSGGGSFGSGYDITAAPTNGLIVEGNVGIGTTTPGTKLEVNGEIRASDGGVNGDANVSWKNGTRQWNWAMDGSNQSMRLYSPTDSVEAMRILASGNVGIGTTTPAQKLDINGGLKLDTATAQPTCNATNRGTFWFVRNGAGIKDQVEVCAKDAGDAFAWRVIY